MFTDVIKDTTSCSFPVKCLGSLLLRDKVTSLLGLQEPLRKLYLSGAGHGVSFVQFVFNYLMERLIYYEGSKWGNFGYMREWHACKIS